jgi:hypothetical protein
MTRQVVSVHEYISGDKMAAEFDNNLTYRNDSIKE